MDLTDKDILHHSRDGGPGTDNDRGDEGRGGSEEKPDKDRRDRLAD